VRPSGGALPLLLLSVASGAMDAIAFLGLGGVLTSAMTGNTALLGIAVGRGDVAGAVGSLIALAAFICGIAAAELISGRPRRLYALEIALALAFAAIWQWAFRTHVLIALSALAMGVQGVAARRTIRFGITTIVFTTPLLRIVRTAVRHLTGDAVGTAEAKRARLEGVALVSYAASVAACAFALASDMQWIAWLPALAACAAVCLV